MFIPNELRTKLEPKSTRGIFMGYSQHSKAYRIWVNSSQKIVESRDVLFDESSVISGIYASTTSQALVRTATKQSLFPVVDPQPPIAGIPGPPAMPPGLVGHHVVIAPPIVIAVPVAPIPVPKADQLAQEIELTPASGSDDPPSDGPVNTFSTGNNEGRNLEDEPLKEIFGEPREAIDGILALWEDITLTDAEFDTFLSRP